MEKNILQLITEELADSLGYKLSKKERTLALPKLPKYTKPYESMNSEQLSVELKELDSLRLKLENEQKKIVEDVKKFMTESEPNQYTQPVYDVGKKFRMDSIIVTDEDHTLTTNLINYVEDLRKKALSKEITNTLCSVYPALTKSLSSAAVQLTPTGSKLVVEISRKKEQRELRSE
jgi:hypothetical protein